MTSEPDPSLDALRAHAEAPADDGTLPGSRRAAHAAVLDRLAAMRGAAARAGWTSLPIERDGPTERIRLLGVPPGASLRAEVPDAIADAG